MAKISEELRETIVLSAKKMKGYQRREYLAEMTIRYADGRARKAERLFGWGRETVEKAIREREIGIRCLDNFSGRGNKRTELILPNIVSDIRSIVDPESQADPQFKTPFAYTRITAKAVRQALIDLKGYTDVQLPHENTIGAILNRIGYKLKRVQKTKPLKKNRANR